MSEGAPPAVDQRASPRAPIVVREARLIAGMEVFFGYAQNVSRGGMFVACAAPRKWSVGEVIELRFRLPGEDRELSSRCRVVWLRPFRAASPLPPGFGLEFLDLPEEDARYIDEWVQRRL